jgi:hypothetical protein
VTEVPGQGCDIRKGVVAIKKDTGRRAIIERPERCAVVSDFVERNRNAEL